MSILAPAKMRLWLELWKEEVMASVPKEDLKGKFQGQQIKKGRLPGSTPDKMQPRLKEGGQIL